MSHSTLFGTTLVGGGQGVGRVRLSVAYISYELYVGSGVMGRVAGEEKRRGGEVGVIYRRWGMCVGVWVVSKGVAMKMNGRMMKREIIRRTTGTVTAEPNSENPRYASLILITSM